MFLCCVWAQNVPNVGNPFEVYGEMSNQSQGNPKPT